jgi:hypothetical protein
MVSVDDKPKTCDTCVQAKPIKIEGRDALRCKLSGKRLPIGHTACSLGRRRIVLRYTNDNLT